MPASLNGWRLVLVERRKELKGWPSYHVCANSLQEFYNCKPNFLNRMEQTHCNRKESTLVLRNHTKQLMMLDFFIYYPNPWKRDLLD